MLAVVDVEVAAAERVGEAAQPRPRLQQRHLATGVRAPQRRRDAGETAAHDNYVFGHGLTPARARIATPAFSQPDSDSRRS